MFRISDRMRVGDLRDIEDENPQLPQYIHRLTARTYAQFIETLYRELYSIVRDMEHDANHMEKLSENALNADVCRQLRRSGYEADSDKNNRGHADITVEFAGYTWIGEGKKVYSVNNQYLKKGYDQILDRYITGKAEENQAALLIYVYAPDAKHVMTQWKSYLTACDTAAPGYAENFGICPIQPEHVFWSERRAHPSSGSTITVRHVAFSMHWNPP